MRQEWEKFTGIFTCSKSANTTVGGDGCLELIDPGSGYCRPAGWDTHPLQSTLYTHIETNRDKLTQRLRDTQRHQLTRAMKKIPTE